MFNSHYALLFVSLSATVFATVENVQFQPSEDINIVACNETLPCANELVSDCIEFDKNCIIDCTKDVEICKNAEFLCHPNRDCTLLCSSTNSCLGTILNASNSNNINVNVQCTDYKACEYMIIDANSSDIHLNVTIKGESITNNASNMTHIDIAQYTAKHSQIYLGENGETFIHCLGHSVCHSMTIHGADSSTLHLEARGQHALKESNLSLPSNAYVNILCGSGEGEEGGACFGAHFDGTASGINTDINIGCYGNDACHHAQIIANPLRYAPNVTWCEYTVLNLFLVNRY